MLKEVGASGQISLGKKYAGQLFDMQTAPDGTLTFTPVKVVPLVQEERASYPVGGANSGGDSWRTPERLARRAAAAARTPTEMEAERTRWEEENKEAIAAMNQRMAHIGSMGRRVHAWRKDKAQQAEKADGAV